MGEYLPLQYLYNVHHEIPLGYLISVYFFYTGLSAGSFLLSSLSSVLGMKKFKPISKIGTVMALTLLAVAPLHLIVDLEQPWRFWHLFVYFNPSSPITYGSFLLTLYPLMTAIYGWFMFRRDFALGARQTAHWRGRLYRFLAFGFLDVSEASFQRDERIVKRLGMITVPLALMVHGYTGFILANVQARGLWNTALMPYIFLMSAVVSGTGLLLILTMIAERFFSPARRITAEKRRLMAEIAGMMVWFILIDAVLLVTDFIVLYYAGTNAHVTAWQMLFGEHQIPFLVYEVLIGLLLPFILFTIRKVRESLTGMTIASLMTLFGVMAMRMNFVVGGQQLQLDGNGWTEYVPRVSHLQMIFGFALLEILLLFLLFYILPVTDEANRWTAVKEEEKVLPSGPASIKG